MKRPCAGRRHDFARRATPSLRVFQELGAKVSLVRDRLEPLTPRRPIDFEDLAKSILKKGGFAHPREDFEGPADPEKEHTVRWQTELLFYRNSEIRRRAKIVNTRLRPDLVLCLHFNAEAWGDPKKPELVEKNHLHALVNGAYLPPELEFDDERFEMINRLLSRAYYEEIGLAEKLTEKLAARTGLPAYDYVTDNVTKVGPSGYVYARNLMATRLYTCPVVYLEPYVMKAAKFSRACRPETTKARERSTAKSSRASFANMSTVWWTDCSIITKRGLERPSWRPLSRTIGYNSVSASLMSSIVTSVASHAEPIAGVTTNRTRPASNFLSRGSASMIFSRGTFAGNFVGKSNLRKRSTIASRCFLDSPAFFIEMAHAATIPRLTASPCDRSR